MFVPLLFGRWLPARQAPDQLDRPLSNFDIAGIPTDTWDSSGSLFECHRNLGKR